MLNIQGQLAELTHGTTSNNNPKIVLRVMKDPATGHKITINAMGNVMAQAAQLAIGSVYTFYYHEADPFTNREGKQIRMKFLDSINEPPVAQASVAPAPTNSPVPAPLSTTGSAPAPLQNAPTPQMPAQEVPTNVSDRILSRANENHELLTQILGLVKPVSVGTNPPPPVGDEPMPENCEDVAPDDSDFDDEN